jgi:hypothetical protein
VLIRLLIIKMPVVTVKCVVRVVTVKCVVREVTVKCVVRVVTVNCEVPVVTVNCVVRVVTVNCVVRVVTVNCVVPVVTVNCVVMFYSPGMACVSCSLVDGRGNPVRLLSCPAPSRLAASNLPCMAELQQMVNTLPHEANHRPGPGFYHQPFSSCVCVCMRVLLTL